MGRFERTVFQAKLIMVVDPRSDPLERTGNGVSATVAVAGVSTVWANGLPRILCVNQGEGFSMSAGRGGEGSNTDGPHRQRRVDPLRYRTRRGR